MTILWQRNDEVTGVVAIVVVVCMLCNRDKQNAVIIKMSNLQLTLIWFLTSGQLTHDCTTLTANSRIIPTGEMESFLFSNDQSNTKIIFCV